MAERPSALWETTRADGIENLKSSRCFPKKPRRRKKGHHALLICHFDLKPFKDWSNAGIKDFFTVIISGFVGLKSRVWVFHCCFLNFFFYYYYFFYFFQVWNFLAMKKTELKPVSEGDAPEATVDLLQTEQVKDRPATPVWAGLIGSSGGWTLRDLQCDDCGFLFPSQRFQPCSLIGQDRWRERISSLQHNKSMKNKSSFWHFCCISFHYQFFIASQFETSLVHFVAF